MSSALLIHIASDETLMFSNEELTRVFARHLYYRGSVDTAEGARILGFFYTFNYDYGFVYQAADNVPHEVQPHWLFGSRYANLAFPEDSAQYIVNYLKKMDKNLCIFFSSIFMDSKIVDEKEYYERVLKEKQMIEIDPERVNIIASLLLHAVNVGSLAITHGAENDDIYNHIVKCYSEDKALLSTVPHENGHIHMHNLIFKYSRQNQP